jgi:hypothetical protein
MRSTQVDIQSSLLWGQRGCSSLQLRESCAREMTRRVTQVSVTVPIALLTTLATTRFLKTPLVCAYLKFHTIPVSPSSSKRKLLTVEQITFRLRADETLSLCRIRERQRRVTASLHVLAGQFAYVNHDVT